MSNQNKKVKFLGGKEFGKFMIFLSKVHQMLQQVLTERPKTNKKVILDQFCIPIYYKIWNMMQKSDSIFRLT